MTVGRILSPVHSLGPGERVCLWTQGCSKKCDGCISTDLQGSVGARLEAERLAEILIQLARKGGCAGLTVSGGDPFEQADELLCLLKLVRAEFRDILVYTGYVLGEIEKGIAGESGIKCLDYIDVLIDGRYIKAKNHPDCTLRGSSNQVIHFFNGEMKEIYAEYMKKGRIIESFEHDGSMIITGILNEEENQ